MKNNFQAMYLVELVDDVICLEDLDTGMSVTNDAERVIENLSMYNLERFPVIYKDTLGNWDRGA